MIIVLNKKKVITVSLLIIFSLIFIFATYKVFVSLIETNKNNKLHKEIIDSTKIEEAITNKEDTKEKIKFIDVDFTNLLSINSDTKGWISFGYINYVFVQGSDNDYYLTKTFKNDYSEYGTLFLDYRNNHMSDKNTVIYGHNSNNMQMFGSLKTLLNKKYFENDYNDIIKISTPTENYNYQIFSVYNIEKEDYYINTTFTIDEWEVFINTITNRSYYDFNLPVEANDKILTLSTCYGGAETSKRTVVHAKLIETMNR